MPGLPAVLFWLFRLVNGGVGGLFFTSDESRPSEEKTTGSGVSFEGVGACSAETKGTDSEVDEMLASAPFEPFPVVSLTGLPRRGFGGGGLRRASCA